MFCHNSLLAGDERSPLAKYTPFLFQHFRIDLDLLRNNRVISFVRVFMNFDKLCLQSTYRLYIYVSLNNCVPGNAM